MAGTVDLGPAELNVRSLRGDTVSLPFTITEGGAPVDITGRTFAAQLRKTATSTSTGPISFEVDIADPVTGQIILRLAETVTATLGGRYLWDLQQTTSGEVRTLVAGEWTVDTDVGG